MDLRSPGQWIGALWMLFGLYWLVSALKRKRTKQRETIPQRLAYVLPLLAAAYLLSQPGARYGWLGARFVPYSPVVEWAGVLLTTAGVGMAFWARWHLGANWSGAVTLKEGHELIRTGPYRAIRHPIYTGIFAGAARNSGYGRRSSRADRGGHCVDFVLYQGAERRGVFGAGIWARV